MSDSDTAEPGDEEIRAILRTVRTIAMVGASEKEDRPSHGVLAYLLDRGYDVVPVNPKLAGQKLFGRTCYATLSDVPHAIEMVDVFRASDAVPGIVDEALSLSPLPAVIWLQLGVRHDEAAAKARSRGLTVVSDRCPKIEHGRLL